MFKSTHDSSLSYNDAWTNYMTRATEHFGQILVDIYTLFQDKQHIIKILKENYPHSCILDSIWDVVYLSDMDHDRYLLEHRDILESIRLSYSDLHKIETQQNIPQHIEEYMNSYQVFLDSTMFSMNDIRLLQLKSGIRETQLCGTIDIMKNDIFFNNMHDWVRQKGIELPARTNNTMYWRMHPYSDMPTIPSLKDFESNPNELHVVFYPHQPKILIYYKNYENQELYNELVKYQTNLFSLITSSNYSEGAIYDLNIGLQEYGLDIWTSDHEELPTLLREIVHRKNILLNTEINEIALKIKSDIQTEINKESDIDTRPLKATALPSKSIINQKTVINPYMKKFTENKNFKSYIHMIQSVTKLYHDFLESSEFKESYFDRYQRQFINPFVVEKNGIFYKK